MSDANDCGVAIFDDFEDAEEATSSSCARLTEEEFEEQMRTTTVTDAALGDLCVYLDQNPDVYARILRKRKQEEMESSGVISFMKSKMMSILHGEKVPQCLISTSECVQQTNALKVGMCKTFQFSQELNGKPTRHSKRLAAKRRETEVDSASKENHCLDQSDATNIPDKRPDSSVISNSTTHPIPPPAPPLPPLLTHHRNTRKSKTANPTGSSAPQSTFDGYDQENDESVAGTSCGHLSNSAGPADKSDGQFLSPMLTNKIMRHKRSLSNSSTGSNLSYVSLASVHSELRSANPLTRLRTTKVDRSPGGTPARRTDSFMSSGPLHKALLTAMKNKFKNVKTPSPRTRSTNASRRSSTASPNNSGFESIGSPR